MSATARSFSMLSMGRKGISRGRRRLSARSLIAVLATAIALLGTATVSHARISLSSPVRLPFVKVENASQLQAALGEASGKPVMVYFAADWCATCSIIESRIFPDKRVLDALASYYLVKVDITDIDPGREALMKDLGVMGPPTIVFFGSSKREAKATRLVGPIDAGDLLKSASKAGAE